MTIEERLEKIERELAAAQEELKIHPIVRANRFELVDENGKKRAELRADKDAVSLNLFDESGELRAGLGVLEEEGPALTLTNENGKPVAGLSVTEDGPKLYLLDENDNIRVMLAVHEDGTTLALSDENRKFGVALSVNENGGGLVLCPAKCA